MIIKDMKTLNNEISRTFQKGNDNFEKVTNFLNFCSSITDKVN